MNQSAKLSASALIVLTLFPILGCKRSDSPGIEISATQTNLRQTRLILTEQIDKSSIKNITNTNNLIAEAKAVDAELRYLKDGWGRWFNVAQGKADVLNVWSIGENGVDEKGNGDDLLISINFQ